MNRFAAALLLLFTVVISASASSREQEEADELLLRQAGLATDGAALLDFFRQRSVHTPDAGEVQSLVKQLGDASPGVREKATGALIARGPAVIPILRVAGQDPDNREVAERARRCLDFLEGATATPLPAAAVRLLVLRKPTGSTEALLAYAPYADDEPTLKEVQSALLTLGTRDGKTDPALLAALKDPLALRRTIAAEAVAALGRPDLLPSLRPLLKDSKPTVRLRVALALGAAYDGDAIPVLIAALGELPADMVKLAEEFLQTVAVDQAPKGPFAADAEGRKKCQEAWAAWWSKNESAALLEELRSRTVSETNRQKYQGLVDRLGDRDFKNREKATADLIAVGRPAAPLLRLALNHTDAEIAKRAQICLAKLDKAETFALPSSVIRILAYRKPEGAVAGLLDYLPFAEDEAAAAEVQTALGALAMRDGKADPLLVRALADALPQRRAGAAEALAQSGGDAERKAVRKLLQDEVAMVRLRVALALAANADREAVPVLIKLLAELPADDSWAAEDFLYRLAGERSPPPVPGNDKEARQKNRDAWEAWWREHGVKLELSRMDLRDRLLGFTLIVQIDQNTGASSLVELGPAGKTRWQIGNLNYAVDAHVVSGNRVLIAEYNASRVTERDFKGTILWQKQLNNSPVNVQRLRNGNTFIATYNQLLEVDKTGKELRSINRNQHDVMAAYWTRNDQIVCLTSGGRCLTMDLSGKELRSFAAVAPGYTSGIDVLANGRILLADTYRNRVVEYDPQGKVVWEATVQRPVSATRLPNGHTLVASNMVSKVLELDRNGKTVWESKDNQRAMRARRR